MPTSRSIGSIALCRSAIARLFPLAVGGAALSACSEPEAPPAVTVTAVAATNGQIGWTGTRLPLPLGVRVLSGGAPKAGVTVTWQASAGVIVPASGETDATGSAWATWTLGPVAGAMTASTSVAGVEGSPVTFRATALPPATITAVTTSNGQVGTAGGALPLPLRVQVQFEGRPKEGATIRWHSSAGAVSPAESVSDGDGFASATWTLGPIAGLVAADASIAGSPGPPALFRATARPGPAVAVQMVRGGGQSSPVNRQEFGSLVVVVTDQYGNPVAGQPVAWTIERGPVAFVAMGGATDGMGQSTATVTPGGTTGGAVVKASFAGSTTPVTFALTVLPPLYQVVLDNYVFRSAQNGSHGPAVDTIPVGTTMEWLLEPFDYDRHRVVSVGLPSFLDGEIPYANPSAVRRTFTSPGTYQYADFYYPDDRGTLVVR